MKSLYKLFLIAIIMLFSVSLSMAQLKSGPTPPGDPDDPGGAPGGSAPVGSGLAILIALGAAYGSKKIYQLKLEEV